MVMKRLAFVLSLVAAGCNKPSEEDCTKAIENMRKLMGTSNGIDDLAPAIRRCRSGSTKESVQCAGNAKSRAELVACKFAHFDEAPAGTGSGSGSAK
jgi:hypothetical protein